jgi:flagellar motor switch protein FliM
VLGEQSINLSEILALKVGSRIIFRLTSDGPVELRCGGVPLFRGKAGNRRNRIAVKIDEKLSTGSTYGAPGV